MAMDAAVADQLTAQTIASAISQQQLNATGGCGSGDSKKLVG